MMEKQPMEKGLFDTAAAGGDGWKLPFLGGSMYCTNFFNKKSGHDSYIIQKNRTSTWLKHFLHDQFHDKKQHDK